MYINACPLRDSRHDPRRYTPTRPHARSAKWPARRQRRSTERKILAESPPTLASSKIHWAKQKLHRDTVSRFGDNRSRTVLVIQLGSRVATVSAHRLAGYFKNLSPNRFTLYSASLCGLLSIIIIPWTLMRPKSNLLQKLK